MQRYKEVNIQEMNRVVVFTSLSDQTIRLEQFDLKSITEAGAYTNELKPEKVGPCMTLTLRRTKFCESDIWKQAIRKRKKMGMRDMKEKNMTTNILGEKRGRVFV